MHRLLVGYANDGDMDKSGRFLLPAPLRTHAGLEKQVMLIGQSNHLAIWDTDKWQQQILKDIDAEKYDVTEQDEHVQGFSLT